MFRALSKRALGGKHQAGTRTCVITKKENQKLDYPLRQSIADIFEVSERNLEEAQSWREFLMGWKRIKQVEDRNREKEDEVLLENCQTTRTVQIFTRDRFAMGMHWVQLALPPHHITDAVDAILGIP
ncbi:hypothetical protein HZH66_006890 [Vespula vulgaris]|uniref:Uncharacterized protein n=1 Tax=Vespula vulgaris TaxID=7454 RepID=A0A834K2C5_VESVU|nr:hypothetical protein HZH66_006890 [Vespula vulgaris]